MKSRNKTPFTFKIGGKDARPNLRQRVGLWIVRLGVDILKDATHNGSFSVTFTPPRKD